MTDLKFSELTAASALDPAMEFGVNDGGVSKKVTGEQIKDAMGLELLGSTVLTVAANSTSVVTIEPRDCLFIFVRVASYGGTPDATGDIASLRFNGDSGANYWSRHIYYDAGTWNDVPQASASLIRLAESNSRLSRNVFVKVNNLATRGKTCNIKNQTGTADATVVGKINVGGGEWVNLTDQITTIQMVNAGSNNMGAGSGFMVMGKNF